MDGHFRQVEKVSKQLASSAPSFWMKLYAVLRGAVTSDDLNRVVDASCEHSKAEWKLTNRFDMTRKKTTGIGEIAEQGVLQPSVFIDVTHQAKSTYLLQRAIGSIVRKGSTMNGSKLPAMGERKSLMASTDPQHWTFKRTDESEQIFPNRIFVGLKWNALGTQDNGAGLNGLSGETMEMPFQNLRTGRRHALERSNNRACSRPDGRRWVGVDYNNDLRAHDCARVKNSSICRTNSCSAWVWML